ncbi:MAG TPA: PAS domain-containing sensor histidine kinase, partial [Daejeonella sp.]|nr:PAS domain-containing sensor histidine kinase [Daejeonella sp.]
MQKKKLTPHATFTEDHLIAIFNASSSPIYVCTGDELIVQYANEATLRAWGKDSSVLGKPFTEALPEIVDQPFPKLLREVYRSGIPYHTENDRADLVVNGELQTFYFKFSYQALKNLTGEIWGVLATATDVTELVHSKQEVEESQKSLRNMIMQAPVAICILSGPDYQIDIANDRMLELWGASSSVIAKPLFEALPELVGQGFNEIILGVYSTGIQFTGSEHPVQLMRNGKIEMVYVNFVYEAMKQGDGIINSIMVVATDVTEQVMAQKRRDDFIGIASHELKTPLTTLKAALQIIEKQVVNHTEPKLHRLIQQSNVSASKLSYLVEDLLNVTKLNEGQLRLNKETFTMSELIDKCCQHVRMEGKHNLVLDGDLTLQLFGDVHRIDQVMVNLVNNAVKYASESEDIHILIERQAHYVKVSVSDKGPGIDPEKVPHLFNRYYRADSTGNQISGLGL